VGRPSGAGQGADLLAWEQALQASGLPLLGLEGPKGRPRLAMGPPVPAGMSAERELLDLWLTRRLTVDVVRVAIVPHVSEGYELVDLHDVWLGEPPLPAQVAAGEYRATLGIDAPSGPELESAAGRLLESATLPRERAKGRGIVRYDLRPLVEAVAVAEPGPPVILRIRTRFDPQLGTGRPAEVMAALEALLGRPIPVADVVRERLVLAGDP